MSLLSLSLCGTWRHHWLLLPPGDCHAHDEDADADHDDGGHHRHDDVQVKPRGHPWEATLLVALRTRLAAERRSEGAWKFK